MTKRLMVAAGLVAALAAPQAAVAKPNKTDKRNAARECRAERGTTDSSREAFREKYGTNANKSNAFGKCVSRRTRDEHAERHAAKRQAQSECRQERAELGREAFAEKYGTNRNKRNAFGKCVSGKAKRIERKEDREDRQEIRERRNAAKECAQERQAMGVQAFREKYGTNHNKRNAFGKCVSAKASA